MFVFGIPYLQRLILSCATILPLLAFSQPGFSTEIPDQTVRVRYSIRLLGLPLGQADFATKIISSKYSVNLSAKLTGIAMLVSDSRGSAESTGVITAGRAQPNTYVNTTEESDQTRVVKMDMSAGRVKNVSITPVFEDSPGRVPIREEHKQQVLDPLSALITPLVTGKDITGESICNRTLPIFDGYTRFDINLTYDRTHKISTKFYDGLVYACKARYVPLAGHTPHKSTTKFMIENKKMEIWLMPSPANGLAIPYYISVATRIGTLVLEMNDLNNSL